MLRGYRPPLVESIWPQFAGKQRAGTANLLALLRISPGACPTTRATECRASTMTHTGTMNTSIIIICGLNAGVQYAQLQRPQFECQLTAQVRVLVT